MKYQVIEKSTGARLAHTPEGQIMGTTLFDHELDANAWMSKVGLSNRTHEVQPVKEFKKEKE